MTAVERYCAVVLRVAEQLVPEREGSGCRQHVDHVNRDAEAGACGNGAREHGDRPANQMVLVAFGRLLAASLGVAVAIGELLVRPATCEPVVGGGEIAHGSVREHDVNAAALPRAGGRSFQQRDAAGAAPYLLGCHGRLADCRPRAPLAARAPRGRGRGRGAWSSRQRSRRSRSRPVRAVTPVGRLPRRRAPAPSPSSAAVAADRARAGVVDRAAPGGRGRRSVSPLVSAVRLRAGERGVGEGGRSRAPERADPRTRAGHSGSARSPPAGGVAASGRDDARVRGGHGDRRRRRHRGVPAALLAPGTGGALAGEQRRGAAEPRWRSSRAGAGSASSLLVASAVPLLLAGGAALLTVLLGGTCSGSGVGDAPSAAATRDIPGAFLRIYEQVGAQYKIPWEILAGIGREECDQGR